VSVELPLLENAPLFEMVTKSLLHELCSQEYPNAPYMVNGVCKKRYPWAFSEETTQSEDGYLVYCSRNDGWMFRKTPYGFAYDNRWVVPHNPYVTKMFNAYINVEVSASIWSVKYLLNTFTKVLIVLQWWSPVQQTKSSNTLTFDIWALLKGLIPYFHSKNIWNGRLSFD
jgi:hypothetical protein